MRVQRQLLYEALDNALEAERQARRLRVQLGNPFSEIERLRTVPGVGRIGAHRFVAYRQAPGRFTTPPARFRYGRLGLRDRRSDGKPLGFQQLDRGGHGGLKAVSYRAWLAAMKRRRGAVYEFYGASLARPGDAVPARLNPQRKGRQTRWVLGPTQHEFDPKTFLGTEAQPPAKAKCG